MKTRYAIEAVDLLDKQKCRLFLDDLAEVLGAPSRKITASLLAKRYAFLILAPGLSAMTLHNRRQNQSIANCRLEYSYCNGAWTSKIVLADCRESELGNGNRKWWRAKLVRILFREHLAPIWRSLVDTSNVSRDILWENTAVRVLSLYEKKMLINADLLTQARIREDLTFLMSTAATPLLGEEHHPLVTYLDDQGRVFPKVKRIRRTCCYHFVVAANRELCSICPKLHSI